MIQRVFLIVLDSFGVGELPDAANYNDQGSNTLAACASTGLLNLPNMARLGLYNIPGVSCGPKKASPAGAYGRAAEISAGKDTTTGHWEIAGLLSHKPMPTYPNGFPAEVLEEFSRQTGRGVLCNLPYSGTEVIKDYGRQHLETGDLIVYTSADSVFQIAAHESLVPPEQLYEYCRMARQILQGEHGVGRVIARPFTGEWPFTRTANRRDFSLLPPSDTMLDKLQQHGKDTIAVGKISDIFAGKGVSERIPTHSNDEGMEVTLQIARERDFQGLCFVNLVDFDMKYGHRNDAPGYANALNRFDEQLAQLLPLLRPEDLLIITADHGCDPVTPSTDHSREYIPILVAGDSVRPGVELGTRKTFADIAATVCDAFGISDWAETYTSFLPEIQK